MNKQIPLTSFSYTFYHFYQNSNLNQSKFSNSTSSSIFTEKSNQKNKKKQPQIKQQKKCTYSYIDNNFDKEFDEIKRMSRSFYQPQREREITPSKKLKTNTQKSTYPYKNPGCGINLTGNSKISMKGSNITVSIDKILNSRTYGRSGSLQLQLIRMSYYYDGTSKLIPSDYTSVGIASLDQLDGGWSFSDVVRTMPLRNSQQHSFRKCYVLLLEQFSQNQFKIVDYVNFD